MALMALQNARFGYKWRERNEIGGRKGGEKGGGMKEEERERRKKLVP